MMARIRGHDEIGDLEAQALLVKRTRRFFTREEHKHSPMSVNAQSEPPGVPFNTPAQDCHFTHALSPSTPSHSQSSDDSFHRDSSISTKYTSPHGHVSSGIEAPHFPDSHHLPSPISHPHSGIKENILPEYNDVPSSPVHVSSGIEGINFPDSYDKSRLE